MPHGPGRARAWAAGGRPERIVLDFDSHLVEVHSEKEGAAPNRKHGFGFHPLGCWLDQTGEALAMVLRPGNAGANTAADHVAVLDAALAQLPGDVSDRDRDQPVEVLARSDSAGATHAFAAALRERRVRFSLGYYVTETVGQAALALADSAWRPALNADGDARDRAWVAELTGTTDLSPWPDGTRLIVRRERPHPGAQLRFTDAGGHRYQAFLTDQTGDDLAALEVTHRLHARVEDRVAEARELGLARLPFWAVQRERDVAGTHPARPRPARLDAHPRPGRRQRPAGAQAAAPPAAARRRTTDALRPAPHAAPARRLALGRRAHQRIRAPARTARARLTAAPLGSTTTSPPFPALDAARTRPPQTNHATHNRPAPTHHGLNHRTRAHQPATAPGTSRTRRLVENRG